MTCGRKLGPFDCCSVVQGDCLELMKLLPDGCVDAVITDPPYGIDLVPQRGVTAAIAGDSDAAAARLYSYAAKESARILVADSVALFFASWKNCHWSKSLLAQYLTVKSCVVWVKNRFGIGYYTRPQHEFIWYCWKGTPVAPERAIADVIDWAIEDEQVHSCQKPLGLVEHLIEFVGGDTILDPFCGSGTTLVAAKKLGRHYLGFEISPEYCEIARKRIALVEAQPSLFEKKAEQLELGSGQGEQL